MVEVIHAAFGARPPLDPPSTASAETPAVGAAALRRGSGIYAEVGGRPAGVILVLPGLEPGRPPSRGSRCIRTSSDTASPRRWSAPPRSSPPSLGYRRVELFAREELAELVAFWRHRGFAVDRPAPHGMILAKPLPLAITVPTARDMRRLGERLAGLLRPGDLVIASGDLGAGKTTLTQGIGADWDGGPDHLADLRAVPDPSVRRPAARRWCTSTPTGSSGPRSWTTSTWTPPWPSRSPSSSGARASPRTWPTAGWRSTCRTDRRRARTAASVMLRPVGPALARRRPGGPRRWLTSGRLTQPLVLALDTATVVNVGLARGGQVLATAPVDDRMAHAEQLMPLVRDCLSQRRTDGRRRRPDRGRPRPRPVHRPAGRHRDRSDAGRWSPRARLHGICSLDVLAAAVRRRPARRGEFVVATDARRREVYWARYAADGRRLDGPQVTAPDDGAAPPDDRPGRRPLPRPALRRARPARPRPWRAGGARPGPARRRRGAALPAPPRRRRARPPQVGAAAHRPRRAEPSMSRHRRSR